MVISSHAYNRKRADVFLMAITSQIRQNLGFGEVDIQNWQSAGLLNSSIIKPVIFTAEKTIIKKTLGKLKQQDQANLLNTIDSIIGIDT